MFRNITPKGQNAERGPHLPLFTAVLFALCAVFASPSAAAERKWESMTFTEDISRDLEEFSRFCMLHDIASLDVLWANNCTLSDLVPGRTLYLPKSRADMLSLWQNQGAWQPKALVQVTSAAAAERAKGSAAPQGQKTQQPAQKKPQPQQKTQDMPPAHKAQSPAPRPTPSAPPTPAATPTPLPQASPDRKPSPAPQTGQPSPAAPSPQTPSAGKKTEKKADPVLVLTPDGDANTGPMRLVISGDSVAVVRLPKSASPKKPSMADLEQTFFVPLLPGSPQEKPDTGGRIGTKMIWPVRGVVSSGFGKRGKNSHDGLDIPMPPGSEICAAKDGIVLLTGSNSTPGFRGYGNFVLMDHGRGVKTLYAHCLKVKVKSGQKIRQGQVIALVGRTGRASTDHVHFEVRVNDKAVDPIPYLR